jgi:putative transposase
MLRRRFDSYLRGVGRAERVEVAGGLYHVNVRGNNRRPIYFGNWSGRLFVRLLGQTAARFGWSVLAYCLMTNHYHVVLEISEGGLSNGMCELNGAFAKLSNKAVERTNHLFGRRFWSELIEDDEYLLTACRYVLLNPERAGAIADARCWRWSSLAATLGYVHRPTFLAAGKLLEYFGGDSPAARERFAGFIQEGRGRAGQLLVPGTELSR